MYEYVCADACGHSYHRVAFIFIACSQRNALALVCLCVSAHQINYFYFDFIEVSLFSSVVACYQSQITPTCLLCPSICFYLISLWLAPHLVSACSLFCINLLVFQFYEGSVLLLSPASLSYQSFQVFFIVPVRCVFSNPIKVHVYCSAVMFVCLLIYVLVLNGF